MAKKNINKRLTQLELITEYFIKNPNRKISHPEIVDWATSEWRKRTGQVFRDPDRSIRQLHQKGFLMKIKKGVYLYNPKKITNIKFEEFSPSQKIKIMKRDNYQCVVCGRSEKNGFELHVDHIKPRDFGGKAVIDNGQTLCSQHNFLKRNLKQTETGKKMFIRLYNLAKKEKNRDIQDFCTDVLQIYEQHHINGHIEWKKE